MSYIIPDKIMTDKRLTNIDRCILGLIYKCHCDICYLSQDMIRQKLGFALKNISNSLKKLVGLGFINYVNVANKRYKLIECTPYFYTFFKRLESTRASYRFSKPIKANTSQEAVDLYKKLYS